MRTRLTRMGAAGSLIATGFIQRCPRAGDSWLNYFLEFRKIGHRPEKCSSCAGDRFPCELSQEV